ncbi:MAG: hypothetical protein ACK4L7_12580, partial [Flavobacteriales bacterium]
MSAAYPLPYAWARAHGVLLHVDRGERWLIVRADAAAPLPAAQLAAVAEAQRVHGPCRLQREPGTAFDARLQAAYAEGSSTAAAIVSEVE